MDGVEVSNDFQDWDLLPSNPDDSSTHDSSFHHLDSGPLLHPDYFSLDARKPSFAGDLDDDKSAASDNPSWIDPGSDENPTRYLHKDPGGFWSDSSSERSQDRKFPESDGKSDIDFPDSSLKGASPQGIGETFQDEGENEGGLGKDSSRSGHSSGKFNHSIEDFPGEENLHVQPEVLGENDSLTSGGNIANDAGNKKTGDLGKRRIVWWKMPMEILRYCGFKMSPAWAVSVAAAVMGFVILGRRLYKMKKKTKRLEIKLTVDDKKISQIMSHANRLNDAFSIVKRVPVIRPSLPGIGSTSTWPVMSLR